MGVGRELSWCGPGLSRWEAWVTLGEMVVMGEVPRDTDNLVMVIMCHMMMETQYMRHTSSAACTAEWRHNTGQ